MVIRLNLNIILTVLQSHGKCKDFIFCYFSVFNLNVNPAIKLFDIRPKKCLSALARPTATSESTQNVLSFCFVLLWFGLVCLFVCKILQRILECQFNSGLFSSDEKNKMANVILGILDVFSSMSPDEQLFKVCVYTNAHKCELDWWKLINVTLYIRTLKRNRLTFLSLHSPFCILSENISKLTWHLRLFVCTCFVFVCLFDCLFLMSSLCNYCYHITVHTIN